MCIMFTEPVLARRPDEQVINGDALSAFGASLWRVELQ